MSSDWQFLVTLNERLRSLRDPNQIQEVSVGLLGEHLQASRLSYAQIEGDDFVITRSYPRGMPGSAGRAPVAQLAGVIADAYRRGETVAVSDLHTDPRFTDAERAQLLATGSAAFVEAPLTRKVSGWRRSPCTARRRGSGHATRFR